jgi:hypothetical protein
MAEDHSGRGDHIVEAITDSTGAGDIVFKTGAAERGRIKANGTATGVLAGGGGSTTPDGVTLDLSGAGGTLEVKPNTFDAFGAAAAALVTAEAYTDSHTGSSTHAVTQTAHGFAVGEPIRYSGTAYVASQADVAANADVIGLVSAVADADHFTVQMAGYITGFTGLTAGSVYYLDPASSGSLTATPPTTAGQVSKPLLLADSTISGYITNLRGIVVPAPSITNFALQLVDEVTSIAVGEGKGHFTVTSALNGLKLVSAIATCSVGPTGTGLSIGVRKNGAIEMLSTNITVDTTKVSSELSATAPVINSANATVATGDVIWFDCDQADSNSVSRGATVLLGFS